MYNRLMSKRKKRLERIRQNPTNVRLDDLRRVLEDYGINYLQTTGSHHTFRYTVGGKTELFVIPYRRPVKVVYVKEALKIIDEVIEERGEDEPDED